MLSDVRFMDCRATRDHCDHLASLPPQRRAQNRPELMILSRSVLVAQQQGLFQPEPGFKMDLKWAPFSVLALSYLRLCVYLSVYLHIYIFIYVCIYIRTCLCVCMVGVFVLLCVLNPSCRLEFSPSGAQLHALQMMKPLCVKGSAEQL